MNRETFQQTPTKFRILLREGFTNPYSIQLENLKKQMFLGLFKPSQLNQEEISNLKRLTTNEELEIVIKILLAKKNIQGQMDSQQNLIIHSKRIYSQSFLTVKHERKRRLPNSFYKVSITLHKNQVKTQQQKKKTTE